MSSMDTPTFVLGKPDPTLKQRQYNGRRINVIECRVKLSSIQGWIDNPRIELAKKKFQDRVGPRELTQDEIYTLMKDDEEIKLKTLRDDIMKNGLREPLTLSHTGKLLDGNRRFFALKYVLDSIPESDSNRRDFEVVDAFVLTSAASAEDEEDVLVEENFSASLKIQWPDYVKAQKVIAAHERGLDVKEIARRFAWTTGKVRETIKIYRVIEDFKAFATEPPDAETGGGGLGLTEQEAEMVASTNYQYFNEAQRSFNRALEEDVEFKAEFFRWIKGGKFSNWSEVRVAHKAWSHPEVRPIISSPQPSAARDAKSTLEYKERLVRAGEEVFGQIQDFTKFLGQLEVQQVMSLPDGTIHKLEETLRSVVEMRKAAAVK
jgi:hypothetical protein